MINQCRSFLFISWDYKSNFSSIFSHFPFYLISLQTCEINLPNSAYLWLIQTHVFFKKKTTFLKFVSIWQNMSVKFPDQMLSVNLEYFIIKDEMQNPITI